MKENKVTKVSLRKFILILLIVGIIVIGGIFLIFNRKPANTENSQAQQGSVVNKTAGDSKSESSEKNTSKNSTNSDETFTNEQIKVAVSNFLELKESLNGDSLLENLTKKGKLSYDSSKDEVLGDGSAVTTVKFEDYKKAMLNYVSESEFNKNWASTQNYSKNDKETVTKVKSEGSSTVYMVNSITKNNKLTYSAKVTSTNNNEKKEEEFIFTIKSYNGNCVIDSFTSME